MEEFKFTESDLQELLTISPAYLASLVDTSDDESTDREFAHTRPIATQKTAVPMCQNNTVRTHAQSMEYGHNNNNTFSTQTEEFVDSQATEIEDFRTYAQPVCIYTRETGGGAENYVYRQQSDFSTHGTISHRARSYVHERTESPGSYSYASPAASNGTARPMRTDFSIAGLLGLTDGEESARHSPVLSETETPPLRSPGSAVTYVYESDTVYAPPTCTVGFGRFEHRAAVVQHRSTGEKATQKESKQTIKTGRKTASSAGHLGGRTPKAVEKNSGKKKQTLKPAHKTEAERCAGTTLSVTKKRGEEGPGTRTKAAHYDGMRMWECLEDGCEKRYTTCTALFYHMKRQHVIDNPRNYYREKVDMPAVKLEPVPASRKHVTGAK